MSKKVDIITGILRKEQDLKSTHLKNDKKYSDKERQIGTLEKKGVFEAIDYSDISSVNDLFDLVTKKNNYINASEVENLAEARKDSTNDINNPEAINLLNSKNNLDNTLFKQKMFRGIRNAALGAAGLAALYYAPSSIAYGGVKLAEALGKTDILPNAMKTLANNAHLSNLFIPTAGALSALAAQTPLSFSITSEGFLHEHFGIPKGTLFGYNKKSKERLNQFADALDVIKRDQKTITHDYWKYANKLAAKDDNNPNTLQEDLKQIASLYNETNLNAQQNHNSRLSDIYLSDDNKSAFMENKIVNNLRQVFTPKEIHRKMETVPADFPNADIYNTFINTAHTFDTVINVRTVADDKKRLIGLKIQALKEAGHPITLENLDIDTTTTGDARADNINQKLDEKYGPVLDEALLIYQGKHSMASPLVAKFKKLAQAELDAFISNPSTDLSRKPSVVLKEFREKKMQKIIQTIAFTANSDDGLISVLMATMDNLEAKMSSTLNEYAKSIKKSKQANAHYDYTSKGKPYNPGRLGVEKTLAEIIAQQYNDKSSQEHRIINALKQNTAVEKQDREKLQEILSTISKNTGRKVWQNSGKAKTRFYRKFDITNPKHAKAVQQAIHELHQK